MMINPKQSGSKFRLCVFLLVIPIIILLITGCQSTPQKVTVTPPPDVHVSALFRAFYDYIGGETYLGKAISPELTESSTIVQWVEAGKMVFDPQAPVNKRFSFAAIGKDMGIEVPPVAPPSQPELHYVEGHTIHPDFWPLYELIGANVVGAPLTEARYNPVRRRYEQFFENLGFYRLVGQPDVRMLLYGVWACGDLCKPYLGHNGDQANTSIDPGAIDVAGQMNPVFVETIDQIGQDLTGSNLTNAYTREGSLEQVFENVVLMTDEISNSTNVRLRPLPFDLNVISDPPKPFSGTPNTQFVQVDKDLGFEIPDYFWDYIYQHGGLEVTGAPITHLSQVDPRTFRQCFTNLCLIYVPDEIESLRIRPEALGYVYRLLFPPPETAPQTTQTPAKEITTMKVWESFPALPSAQPQEIGAILLSNYSPISGIVLELMVVMPNGAQQFFNLPATDHNGRTSILLPPIVAPNGTIIEYQVCISRSNQYKFCVGDSFMIWNE